MEGRAFATFEADIQRGHLIRHRVQDIHLDSASSLIAEYPSQRLRALDALHLAVALDLGVQTMVTADRVVATAAEAVGLAVVTFIA